MTVVLAGRLHPVMADIARLFASHGWRVTSGYRPTGTHASGLSIDVACMDAFTSGFGLNTAHYVSKFLKHHRPNLKFLVLGENNHIHISLVPRFDVVGEQLPGCDQIFQTPSGQPLNKESVYMQLPNAPMGDILIPADMVPNFETGDVDYDETGAPRLNFGRMVARIAKGGKGGKASKSLVNLTKADPRSAAMVEALATAKKAAKTTWATFEHVKYGKIISATLGSTFKLRPYEIDAMKTYVVDAPPVEPRVISFPAPVSGVSTIELDAILNSLFGLAPGFLFRYVGIHLYFLSSELNKVKGVQLTIDRDFGGSYSLTTTAQFSNADVPSKSTPPSYSALNGRIVSGRARFTAPYVPVAAVATGNWSISVSGIPTGMNVYGRLYLPGDASAERLFALI